MISLTGNLYRVFSGQFTDRETGVISTVHTAEVLHTSNGKSEILPLKFDESVLGSWTQATGKNISCEVRFYALSKTAGGLTTGLMLADKKSSPVLVNVLESIKKAA